MKENIYQYTEDDLRQKLIAMGQPKFRAKQICQWIYEKGITDFSQMSNLSKKLRKDLSESFQFGSLHQVVEQVALDGTKKRLYRLYDK